MSKQTNEQTPQQTGKQTNAWNNLRTFLDGDERNVWQRVKYLESIHYKNKTHINSNLLWIWYNGSVNLPSRRVVQFKKKKKKKKKGLHKL